MAISFSVQFSVEATVLHVALQGRREVVEHVRGRNRVRSRVRRRRLRALGRDEDLRPARPTPLPRRRVTCLLNHNQVVISLRPPVGFRHRRGQHLELGSLAVVGLAHQREQVLERDQVAGHFLGGARGLLTKY